MAWWRSRRNTPLRVILYGRQGCHLCEDAAEVLGLMSRSLRIEVVAVDIEDDDALVAEYALRIPVVVAADTGAVLAEGRVERGPLLASLRSFSRSR